MMGFRGEGVQIVLAFTGVNCLAVRNDGKFMEMILLLGNTAAIRKSCCNELNFSMSMRK